MRLLLNKLWDSIIWELTYYVLKMILTGSDLVDTIFTRIITHLVQYLLQNSKKSSCFVMIKITLSGLLVKIVHMYKLKLWCLIVARSKEQYYQGK